MGRKRRRVAIDDPARWVFNRIAQEYGARPAYPDLLIDALTDAAPGSRLLDVGAGTGHLALPLARRGFAVTALEPAVLMLEALTHSAHAHALPITALHAKAESLPLPDASFDAAIVADALHFLDVDLAGAELGRVVRPRGVLALVTWDFAPTPFMNALAALLFDMTQRRPRSTEQAVRHLTKLAQSTLRARHEFEDAQELDLEALENVLRTLSFVGPAMNAELFERLRAGLSRLPEPRVFARRITLEIAQRWR